MELSDSPIVVPANRMGSTPAVSVIIPAYRVTAYIGDTLDSVLAQTFHDYEIIVVNDGCPDTQELEAALEKYRRRIVYIKQENRGLSAARNTGIRAARAPLIAFLDADDLYRPNYLEVQLAKMRDDPTLDVLYCEGEIFGEGPEVGHTLMELWPSRGEVTFLSLVKQDCTVTVAAVVKREAIAHAGYFDEALRSAEDFDLWLRIARAGGRIAYHRAVLFQYRKRQGSLSSDPAWMWQSALRVLRKHEGDRTLSEEETAALTQSIAKFEARAGFSRGKQALLAGDVIAGAKELEAANRVLRNWKVSLILSLLRISPGAAIAVTREWGRLLKRSADMRLLRRIQDVLLLWSRVGLPATLRIKLTHLRRRFGLRLPGRLELRPAGCRYKLSVRSHSSDYLVFHQVFVSRQYAALADLPSPQWIIDCGANVGYTSIYFLNRFPQARVIAVEPSPENFELCRNNLAPYGSRAQPLRAGVWSRSTGLVLLPGASGENREWAAQVREAYNGERPDIEAMDLPALLRLAGGAPIDLLKIDIEGGEWELFRTGTETWLPRVRNIVIEIHGPRCREVFFQALQPYRFDLTEVGELTICRNLTPSLPPAETDQNTR